MDILSRAFTGLIVISYTDNKRHVFMSRRLFSASIISLMLIVSLISNSCAQDASISGQFEVTDSISNVGNVDVSLIDGPLFSQDGIVIWQVVQNSKYPYIDQLDFYAKIDKNNNELSILLSGKNQSESMRGMIPSLYGDNNYALSTIPDESHNCYEYTKSKTLIYSILMDAFDDLKTKSVISPCVFG